MPNDTSRPIVFSAAGRRAGPPTIAALMNAALENPSLLSLAAGFTDNGSLPLPAVRQAVEDLAKIGAMEPLQYGTNQGRPGLRRMLAAHLRTWEPDLAEAETERNFFITNGSQQALYLAMQVLCEPGDIVLVDRPTYFVYLEMIKAMGIRAISLPVNTAGKLDEAALDELLHKLVGAGEAERIKAVYFVSYFSNPSSRSLDAAEKVMLARVLARRSLILPVIEDAAYRDLYYAMRPEAPSVLSIEAWSDFPKLYLSTLTKPFATGLKVGYGYCTDREWLARMLHTKGHHDFGSANFNQAVLERVIASGGLTTQLATIRPRYEAKMLALHETLVGEGVEQAGWTWNKAQGGLYLWLKGPDHVDTRLDAEFCRRCIDAGVLYVPGDLCFGDDIAVNYMRLSFGVLAEPELREAGRRLAEVARSF